MTPTTGMAIAGTKPVDNDSAVRSLVDGAFRFDKAFDIKYVNAFCSQQVIDMPAHFFC